MKEQSEEMFAEERKQIILDLVNEHEKITVKELCTEFSVSPATIRNDLRALEGYGLLKRTHGGAVSNSKVGFEPVFEIKETEKKNEKRAIGKYALRFLQDNDVIILDTGSTALEFAKQISRELHLTVITNDLRIASCLEKANNITVVMLGGIIRKNYHYTLGSLIEDTIKNFNADKVFLGINGLDIERGLTTSSLETSGIKKEFIKAAKSVIVLADSSKFGVAKLEKVADITSVYAVVTDKKASDSYVSEIKKKGVKVYKA